MFFIQGYGWNYKEYQLIVLYWCPLKIMATKISKGLTF